MADVDPRVSALLERGVVIPRPDLVVVDATVDPAMIERGAELLPGVRLEGPKTLVGAGSRIGTAGPAVVRNCAIGRKVELASGVFEDSVFLDGAAFGPGAHARGGTLFEERARAAHAVGTKHTILLPFVTLGSLINFCDCLMSGGSGDADHSEVGSGFIHFNFTPSGDKATPSLFGDATRGVFLRERRIFLGGHAGVVGPVRVGFGSVLAAGSVFRRDVGEGLLVVGEGPAPGSRPFDPVRIRGAQQKVRKNLEFLAEIVALSAFHRGVRKRLAGSDPYRRALANAASSALAESIGERVRQLDRFGGVLARSSRQAAAASAPADEVAYQAAFEPRLEAGRAALAAPSFPELDSHPGRDVLVASVPEGGEDYLAWVRRLSSDAVAAGVRWLEAVRERYLETARSAGL